VALYSEAQLVASSRLGLEREILLVIAVAYDEKLDQSDKRVEYFRLAQRSSRRTRPRLSPGTTVHAD